MKRNRHRVQRLPLTTSATCLTMWIASMATAQTTLHVSEHVDTMTSDESGDSWPNAMPSLCDAFDAAAQLGSGTIIKVGQGTYFPCDMGTQDERENTFLIDDSLDGVRIIGGYKGWLPNNTLPTNPEERDTHQFHSILSGDLGDDDSSEFGNRDDNVYHVVLTHDVTNDEEPTTLDGFTIRGGQADEDTFDSSPFLAILRGDHRSNGAGLHAINSRLNIISCTLEDNQAVGNGPHGFGGGAYVTYDFDNPLAGPDGTRFISCTFRHNDATRGGGFAVEGDHFDPNSNPFVDPNTSVKATFTNCLIHGNTAVEGPQTNVGSNGSASVFLFEQVKVELINCTIVDNEAENETGGVLSENVQEPECENPPDDSCLDADMEVGVTMTNCIAFLNRQDETGEAQILRTADLGLSGLKVNVAWCNIEGGFVSDHMVDVATSTPSTIDDDPEFADVANENYRLLRFSPVINAGDTASVPADVLDIDEDNNVTEQAPDADKSKRVLGTDVDLGAHERCFADSAGGGDGIPDGRVDVTDLLQLLADWTFEEECDDCTTSVVPKPDTCVSDFNLDCQVNVTDLLNLLAGWGNCQSAAAAQAYEKSTMTAYGIISDLYDQELQPFPDPPLTLYQAAADDFRATADSDITVTRWWGFYDDDGSDCTSGYTDSFTVTFYESDLHGTTGTRIPGTAIATFTTQPTRTLMPDEMGNGLPLYMYTLEHDAVPVDVDVCYFIEVRNDGGDADSGGCHWHWAFSDETEHEYSVYWIGTASAGVYDVMGDPTVEQNLAFALDIDFERYDPEGYCPTE